MSKSTIPQENTKPVIFWHSDPVRPNETVVLAGGDFNADSVVEFCFIEEDSGKTKWKAVKPVQYSRISLKAIVPVDYSPGMFGCRVKQENQVSATVYLNEPDAWWMQGDEGVDRVSQSGWLRILGKCLELTSKTAVKLEPIGGGEEIILNLTEKSEYSLKAEIPAMLTTGKYRVSVNNGAGGVKGWRNIGEIEALEAVKPAERILNVVDFGADPGGMKDSTLAIVQATERLSCLGGGIVYFPRGRYRIDSILRSGTWIASPLIIPEKVSFRGDGADLSCLWWPDQDEPLTCLIEGRSNFSIEDLSIYTQGRHSTLISGENNVRINRVLIRANCCYMTLENGAQAHHGRKLEGQGASGSAIMLWGDNNQVTNCDIYTSALALDLRSCRGSLIADNKIRAQNMHFMSGCCEMIFEKNQFSGNQLTTGGNN
ncbi:MAG: hypothetical protein JXR78_18800, partial [Victivallales bacterium]|nr:hypothetical protein [Victivallales bacterium]